MPDHADINYHWHTRVRLHIPVFTQPEVRFHCGGQTVHMAAGDAWIFDNWRRHHVENKAPVERIHLVADTSGSAAFWRFACGQALPRAQWRTMSWNPATKSRLLTECNQRPAVMPAAEVQLLLEDLCAELVCVADSAEARVRAARFLMVMESFIFDWRQLCALHGVDRRARPEYLRLVARVREAARPLAHGLVMRTNEVSALLVLEKRVLQHLILDEVAP